jgi:hypothetical protein
MHSAMRARSIYTACAFLYTRMRGRVVGILESVVYGKIERYITMCVVSVKMTHLNICLMA